MGPFQNCRVLLHPLQQHPWKKPLLKKFLTERFLIAIFLPRSEKGLELERARLLDGLIDKWQYKDGALGRVRVRDLEGERV